MSAESTDFLKTLVKLFNISTKKGLEFFTAAIILLFSFLFCVAYIFPIHSIKSQNSFLVYTIIYLLLLFIQFFLFKSDRLYEPHEKPSRYAKAFQKYFPSKYIAEQFDINLDEARYYWYNYVFNKWQNPSHPNHDQWVKTLQRGFSCRLVYYVLKFFELIMLLSILLIIARLIVFRFSLEDFFVIGRVSGYQLIYLVGIFVLYAAIRAGNSTDTNRLTGVWFRFAEINKNHRYWLRDNFGILDDLKNYEANESGWKEQLP